jgi:cytochrome c5
VRRVIILWVSRFASLLLLSFSSGAPAASGVETYKAKCALCHDAGATGAPRIDRPADWTKRAEKGYAGLLRSAMQGVPGTAMLPKAGFPELSESEVSEALRYMVLGLGLQLGELDKGPLKAQAQARRPVARVDDITLAMSVADALVNAKIGGVQVVAREGHITLKGMVDDAAAVARALKAAQGVAGVRAIENRLVSAEIFEHD